jgi:peptide/nickel transport system permease protein
MILRRLAVAPIVLVGMTFLTFVSSEVIPVDPVAVYLGATSATVGPAEQAQVALIKEKWGWDKPVLERYLIYLGNISHGDLGVSSTTRRPVSDDIRAYLPATIELVIAIMLLALVVAIPLGVIAASRRGKAIDVLLRIVSTLGMSTPVFWLAVIAYTLFYGRLGIAAGPGQLSLFIDPPPRVTGMLVIDSLIAGRGDAFADSLYHLAFPACLLGILIGLYLMRIVRTEMIDALESDYVRTARGKGLRETAVLYRHALRNALVTTVTLSGLVFAYLFTGTLIVESIVGWPGLGSYAFRVATKLDLTAISGVVLVVGAVYVLVNLAVDSTYAVLDPRVRIR